MSDHLKELLKLRESGRAKPFLGDYNLRYLPKPPEVEHISERHMRSESAGALIESLKQRIEAWQATLPEDVQPVVLAILSNGQPIRVSSLSQEGHNGIVIREAEMNTIPVHTIIPTVYSLCRSN